MISAPGFLRRDKNGRAIIAALDAALDIFVRDVDAALKRLLDVKYMDEARLDELAWEYALPWYDFSADVDIKRRTIADMRKTLMEMGTPAAMARVVSAQLGSAARLAEWFEYGGEPYHFRIISAGEILDAARRRKFYAAIDAARNVRSVMDEMIWAYAADGVGYTAAAAASAAIRIESEVAR